MYRAGSTWQYQVVSHLLEKYRQGKSLGFRAGPEFATCSGDLSGWACLKAHDGHPAFADWLRAGRARAIYSYRDLRDVAFSLAHVFKTDVDDVLDTRRLLHTVLDNDTFWTALPHTIVQRYEDLTVDPESAIREMAAHLDIPLADGEARSLAEQFSMSANRKRITEHNKELSTRGIDPRAPAAGLHWEQRSLLHWNHIRGGQVGGWQSDATVRQRLKLGLIGSDWLRKHGYALDDRWVLDGLPSEARQTVGAEIDALRNQYASEPAPARQLEALIARIAPEFRAGVLKRWWNWASARSA
jgi:hypothetical protein